MSQTIVPFMNINTYSIAFITFDRTNDGRIKLLLECDFKLPTGEQLIFYLQTSKDKDHLSENDYNYFSSLGLENTMLVIDMELQDNYFELR